MDQNEFSSKLNYKLTNNIEHISEDIITLAHKNYINYHLQSNPDEILVIPMEEMAELTQHLSKILRKKETTNNLGLLEELADVQICIDNLKRYFNIDEDTFKYAMDVKLDRGALKIKNGTA